MVETNVPRHGKTDEEMSMSINNLMAIINVEDVD
jgi:hypothetical protein